MNRTNSLPFSYEKCSMEYMPLVSVLVPAYNHEEYIESALESAFNQTYPEIEVIVIDDGSRDCTREVIRKLRGKFQFGYIENRENLGLTKSLNVALSKANGKYISILAGDDLWLPEKTAIQVKYMEQHPEVAACSGNVKKIDENGDAYKPYTDQKVDSIEYRSFEDCMLLQARFPAVVTLVRKERLLAVGGYDERFAMEDLPLWLRFTASGWKIAVLPELLGLYRIHSTSLSKNHARMFDSYITLFSDYKYHQCFNESMRAVYTRQIKFGPYRGWRALAVSIWRGFKFEREYFKNLMICLKRCPKYMIKIFR